MLRVWLCGYIRPYQLLWPGALVRPRPFRPSACSQWLAQALGPLSENSHFQAFLGLRVVQVTVVVVFLVLPSQQPSSPLPEVRKHYPEQNPVDLLLGKINIEEVILLTPISIHFAENAKKVNNANGLVSSGIRGQLNLKLALNHLFVCLRFHLLWIRII